MFSAASILGIVAAVLALFAAIRLWRNRGRWDSAARTWTLIAVIFVIVSVVLSRGF